MIILGLDPGSRFTGYGLIAHEGSRLRHVDNGLIVLTDYETLAERLKYLFEKVTALIEEFKPVTAAIESVFYSKNVASTVKLSHARGVLMAACGVKGLAVSEFTPLEVKKAVVGYGGASKDQVQKMVRVLLNLPSVAEENASDALAVALCQSQGATLNTLLLKQGMR